MTSFPDSLKSTALAVYPQQQLPAKQARISMQRMQDIFIRSSLKTQVADCCLSAFPIRALILTGAFPSPQVGPALPKPFEGTCVELLDGMHEDAVCTVRETVHATIDALDYNGLPPYIKTLEQLAEGRSFIETRIDSRNEEPGSTCVGRSHALLKTLKTKHGIEGMFAAQRKQGHQAFCHAAVIVECRDGYVLLDARDAPNLRIFSIPFEQRTKQGDISHSASMPGSTIPVSVTYTNETQEETFEYCTNIANGDDLVMKHFIMEAPFEPPNNPAFPISTYYPKGGASKCIWISLLQSKLTLKNMTLSKGNKDRTDEISFQEIQDGRLPSRLQRFYYSGMPTPTFHIPFDVLHEQLVKFVKNAEVIKQIFQAYMR